MGSRQGFIPLVNPCQRIRRQSQIVSVPHFKLALSYRPITVAHSSTSASPPHPKLAKDALNGDLSERNAWPSEEQGKMGREEAWKHRK
jgi:hypothetical protein